MAASVQPVKLSENPETVFNAVIVQFFEMIPIRRMKWESSNISSENLDVLTQRRVLDRTLRSEMCQKYPPALSYRKAFVKKLLHVLEEFGVEICDDIYEVYTELLQQSEGGEETLCYKTYTIDGSTHNYVTLQESVNMVSFGTTGLSTWQAAQHLSEWILQNCHLFQNKNILELGSGLGLTGIVTCKQCQVKSFTFTDLHKQVLELLAQNIQRNLSHSKPVFDVKSSQDDDRNTNSEKDIKAGSNFSLTSVHGEMSVDEIDMVSSSSKDSDAVFCNSQSDSISRECGVELDKTRDLMLNLCPNQWERHESFNTYVYKDMCRVRLAQLDWEQLDVQLVDHLSDTDIVIAADVVYDNRIIPHLVSTMKKILYSNDDSRSPTIAYLASTIRNEDTRDQFLIALSTEGLNYQQVEGPQIQLFHYDKSVPIEILKLTAADL